METQKDNNHFWDCLFVLIFCSLAIAPFLLYSRGGIGVDEGFYLFKGYSILQGSFEQHDFWKVSALPAIYFLLAGIFSLFGKTYIIPRMLVYILNCFTAVLIYKIGKTCYNSSIGKIASILFLLAMIIPQFEAYGLMLEPFVNILCLIGLYFFIDSKRKSTLFFSGLIIGAAILFKPVALLFLCGLFGYYLLNIRVHRTIDYFKLSIIQIWYVILGICTLVIIDVVYFWAIGSLNNFLSPIWNLILQRGLGFSAPDYLPIFLSFEVVWLFAIATIGLFIIDYFYRKYDENELLFISMLVCFTIPLLSRPYGHYFILIVPYTCLLAAKSFNKLYFASITNWSIKKINLKTCFLFFMICMTIYLSFFTFTYFQQSEAYLQKESVSYLADQIYTSQYIVEHTSENAKILVFGYEPSIYFLTGRDPATNILIFDFSRVNSNYMSEEEVIGILKNKKPYTIVKKGEINNQYFPNISEYLKQNYHVEVSKGRFDIYNNG